MAQKEDKVRKQGRKNRQILKTKNAASVPSPFQTEKHFISEDV